MKINHVINENCRPVSELIKVLNEYKDALHPDSFEIYRNNTFMCLFYYQEREVYKIEMGVHLNRTPRDTYTIDHFDKKCLPGMIDKYGENYLLDAFYKNTEFFDDCKEGGFL